MGAAGFTAPVVLVAVGSAVVALTPNAEVLERTDEEEEEEDNGRREILSNEPKRTTPRTVPVEAPQRHE